MRKQSLFKEGMKQDVLSGQVGSPSESGHFHPSNKENIIVLLYSIKQVSKRSVHQRFIVGIRFSFPILTHPGHS